MDQVALSDQLWPWACFCPRLFEYLQVMIPVGAILVAALGAAVTAGVAALRGELGMGMWRLGGGRMGIHMDGRHHDRRHGKGPESGQGAESTASLAPDAATVARPLPPQWLMIAGGLLRAVVGLVPLSLIVAGLAWILHRTSVPTIQPSG